MSDIPIEPVEDAAKVSGTTVEVSSGDDDSHAQSQKQDSIPNSFDLTSLQQPLHEASHKPHIDEHAHQHEHDHEHDHDNHAAQDSEHDEDQEGAEYILELQETLDSMNSDDPTRPTQLFLLSCVIADHHVKTKTPGIGELPRAIHLMEAAISATSDSSNVQCSYYNALQNICWTAYQATREIFRLDDCIKYGRLAVGQKFPSDLEDP